MSDQIISLVQRRAKTTTLAGRVVFSNRALKLVNGISSPPSPEWSIIQGRASLDGRSELVPFEVQLGSAEFADGPGGLYENEHGLCGELNFEAPYFNLLQMSALSGADLELAILFAANDGDVVVLSLSIEHKTA
ncbi:hypothetical protein [uncultured Brevundimonas sp.]|uniref:hypothetical protein n=1 Tax=uncultured Brevundimonas sp. TaxID=213418 RepID=UPI0026354842|nr:hypothetical protein [uncultured Brevundimonas sp.]